MPWIRSAAYTLSGAAGQNVLAVTGMTATTLATVKAGMPLYLGSYQRALGDPYFVASVDTTTNPMRILVEGTLAADVSNSLFAIDKGTSDGSPLGNVLDNYAKISSAQAYFFGAAPGPDAAQYAVNKATLEAVSRLSWQVGKADHFALEQRTGTAGGQEWALRASNDGGATYADAFVVDRTTGGVRFRSHSTTVASAATVDLGAIPSRRVKITGTTAITSFGAAPHQEKKVHFDGALTLTHSSPSLTLPFGASIVTAAGDRAEFQSDADGNWVCTSYSFSSAARARAYSGAYGSGDTAFFNSVYAANVLVAQYGGVNAAALYGAAGGACYLGGLGAGATNFLQNGNTRLSLDASGNLVPAGSANTSSGSQTNLWSAVWSYTLNSYRVASGNVAIGSSLQNVGSGVGTSVVTDYAPNSAGPGIRSVQIGAVNTDGSTGVEGIIFLSNYSAPVDTYRFAFNAFYPSTDGGWTIGKGSRRAGQIYSTQSTISTSEGREKAGLDGTPTEQSDWRVTPLTAAELAWSKSLAAEIGFYKWRATIASEGLDVARQHCGMTVQRAIALAAQSGIDDPMRYGFVCYDSWEAEAAVPPTEAVEAKEAVWSEPEVGEDGTITKPAEMLEPAVHAAPATAGRPATPAGERHSFRYEQLAMFIAAGQEARLAALEAASAA